MTSQTHPPSPEREQTDESLRVERERSDLAARLHEPAVEDLADAIITKARARADQVLAIARAKADRAAPDRLATTPSLKGVQGVELDRMCEDRALETERSNADATLRAERAEDVAVLRMEREKTDKDLLRERALADQALATRDEFLGIVSHDLQNMLNGVVLAAGLIVDDASRDGHAEHLVSHGRRIQRSGARMTRLIGDLVDVASIAAGMLAVTREEADPAQVVTEAVDTLRAQASAHGLTLTANAAPSSASFDPARIFQVLVNLISNAIKFTPRSGEIVVGSQRSGDDVLFTVRDTGVGIPHEMLEAVFDRFLRVSRADRRGVGLGLYISRAIVRGHGGRIWVDSVVGTGSTFSFAIPIEAGVDRNRLTLPSAVGSAT